MNSSKRIPMKGDEPDVLTGWRRFYKYAQRPGVAGKVKRGYRRRERRVARQRLKVAGDE